MVSELRQGVAKANRRLSSVENRLDTFDHRLTSIEGKMEGLRVDFAEFRGEVKAYRRILVGEVAIFVVAFIGVGYWLAN